MTYSIEQALTPWNEDETLDLRYSKTTQRLIEELGTDAVNALDALRDGQLGLAQKHGWAAIKLVDVVYEIADEIDKNEDHQYRWKSKRLKSQLQKFLERNGLSRKQATMLVQAKKFKEKLRFQAWSGRKPKVTLVAQLDWIESLGVSAQYELSRMSEEGIRKVHQLSKKKETNPTVREIEDIRKEYPKNPPKALPPLQPTNLEIAADDSSSTTEVVEPTKYEKAAQLRDLAIELFTEDAWKDTQLIEILSPAKDALFSHAHVASLPTQPLITI